MGRTSDNPSTFFFFFLWFIFNLSEEKSTQEYSHTGSLLLVNYCVAAETEKQLLENHLDSLYRDNSILNKKAASEMLFFFKKERWTFSSRTILALSVFSENSLAKFGCCISTMGVISHSSNQWPFILPDHFVWSRYSVRWAAGVKEDKAAAHAPYCDTWEVALCYTPTSPNTTC